MKERLEEDLKAAMRAKDTLRRDTLRFVLSAVHNEEVARMRAELTDADVQDVLQKQAKMRRDSIDAFKKGDRPELVAKEEAELALIQAYLPQQLTEAEVRAVVARVIDETGAAGPRDMSKVMPKVVAETKDRADGKTVAALVQALLKERVGT
ncbi:MAG: GatB/YqeY domain-containing protein [Chloroflexota bacterium]